MNQKADDKKVLPASSKLPLVIRRILIGYLISSAAVLAVCIIFGLRSLENIGAGFTYGALGMALFGALLLGGNTVPAQLSKLSLVFVRRSQEDGENGPSGRNEGKRFFYTTLIWAVLLFATGIVLKW